MTTYTIHKGINHPIEFRGLKAQYILYAGGIVVGAILFFALLYIAGLNSWICILVCALPAFSGVGWCYRCSQIYGEFGRSKRRAARLMPKTIRLTTRTTFFRLNKRYVNNATRITP